MNIRLFPLVLAALSLLFSGCLPESKNPLSTPATSVIDSRLEGIYVARRDKKDDDLAAWHFHYRGENGANGQVRVTPWLDILSIELQKAGGLKGESYRALATHLGGRDYLSFVVVGADKDKGKVSLFSFARYEVNWSGELRVWIIDQDAVAAAIRAGKIKGTVEVNKKLKTENVMLTDSTDHLAAFVAASDPAKLFKDKPLVFYRLAR